MRNTLPISEHGELRQVMLRYDVSPDRQLMYSYEELTRLDINVEFVIALLAVFEDPESAKPKAFQHFRLEVIVDYIRKTHHYYLHRKMLEIEQSIHLLLNSFEETHPLLLILSDFYADYRAHLSNHIDAEETQLLPYIIHLEKVDEGRASFQAYASSISLDRFFVHHQDTEKNLAEIRETILQYAPPPSHETLYRILLSQLEAFEKDLSVHALIEDEVLLPRAMALERKWGR
jgi:regulator of cell morphogenesis and NO signaling